MVGEICESRLQADFLDLSTRREGTGAGRTFEGKRRVERGVLGISYTSWCIAVLAGAPDALKMRRMMVLKCSGEEDQMIGRRERAQEGAVGDAYNSMTRRHAKLTSGSQGLCGPILVGKTATVHSPPPRRSWPGATEADRAHHSSPLLPFRRMRLHPESSKLRSGSQRVKRGWRTTPTSRGSTDDVGRVDTCFPPSAQRQTAHVFHNSV